MNQPAIIRRLTFAVVATVSVGLAGCGLVEHSGKRLDARVVAEVIEQRTQIGLARTDPPASVPGLPNLAATLSGATTTEHIVVLDFYTAQATSEALGGAAVDGRDVLRRQNLLILYDRAPGGPDHRAALKAALAAATYRG